MAGKPGWRAPRGKCQDRQMGRPHSPSFGYVRCLLLSWNSPQMPITLSAGQDYQIRCDYSVCHEKRISRIQDPLPRRPVSIQELSMRRGFLSALPALLTGAGLALAQSAVPKADLARLEMLP